MKNHYLFLIVSLFLLSCSKSKPTELWVRKDLGPIQDHVVFADQVFVQVNVLKNQKSHEKISKIIALNATTGETLWESPETKNVFLPTKDQPYITMVNATELHTYVWKQYNPNGSVFAESIIKIPEDLKFIDWVPHKNSLFAIHSEKIIRFYKEENTVKDAVVFVKPVAYEDLKSSYPKPVFQEEVLWITAEKMLTEKKCYPDKKTEKEVCIDLKKGEIQNLCKITFQSPKDSHCFEEGPSEIREMAYNPYQNSIDIIANNQLQSLSQQGKIMNQQSFQDFLNHKYENDLFEVWDFKEKILLQPKSKDKKEARLAGKFLYLSETHLFYQNKNNFNFMAYDLNQQKSVMIEDIPSKFHVTTEFASPFPEAYIEGVSASKDIFVYGISRKDEKKESLKAMKWN